MNKTIAYLFFLLLCGYSLRASFIPQEVPEPVMLILQEAAELTNTGDPKGALDMLSSAKELYPEAAPRVLVSMGIILLTLNDYAEAAYLLQEGYQGNRPSALLGLATIARGTADLKLSQTITPALFEARRYKWDYLGFLITLGLRNDIKSPIYYSELIARMSPADYMSVEPLREWIHEYAPYFAYVPNLTAILNNYPPQGKESETGEDGRPIYVKEVVASSPLKMDSAAGGDSKRIELSGNGLQISSIWFPAESRFVVRLSYPSANGDGELSFEIDLRQMNAKVLDRPDSEPKLLSDFFVEKRTTVFEDPWIKIDVAGLQRAADGDLRLGMAFLLKDGDQYLRNHVVYDLGMPKQAALEAILSGYAADTRELTLEQRIGFLEDFNARNPTYFKGYLHLAEAVYLKDGAQAAVEALQKAFRDYPLESLKILANIALKEKDSKLALVVTPGLMHYRSKDANCIELLIGVGLMAGIDSPIYYSALIQGLRPSFYLADEAVRSLIHRHKSYFSYIKDLDENLKNYPLKSAAEALPPDMTKKRS